MIGKGGFHAGIHTHPKVNILLSIFIKSHKATSMPISRRIALKQVFTVVGGVIFLPACYHQHKDKVTMVLGRLRVEGAQQDTLEALADTLVPAGSSPGDATLGAKAVGAHLFVWRMIADCYPENQQQQFMRGLAAFEDQAFRQYGKTFASCDPKQKETLVAALDASASSQGPSSGRAHTDLSFFLRENKKLLIQGYLGSQYFLTKIEVYELVPGRWHGCTPVIKKT
jgi:hypothetical protein